MKNSRDGERNFVQGSDRCEQPRDPATAGVRVMVAVRRSIVPACRPGAVESVSLLDVSSPINCAGWVRSAGGFFGADEAGVTRATIGRMNDGR